MSKSSITTDDVWSADPADWLHNPGAGEILRLEFLDPIELTSAALGEAINVDPARLDAVLADAARIDADLDLRLSRYFGMSAGFFLGLQAVFDLEEARRANGPEIDRIVRRAA